MPAFAGMTVRTCAHAALCRARQSRFALRPQPTQYRLHGGRGDRQAPRHHALAAALPGRGGRGTARRREGAAAAARHLHERIRGAPLRRPRISTSSASATSWCFTTRSILPPAKVRVKTGGGVAGHNGLRSITAHIGNDYRRVRIGVGHPGVKDLVHAHVLNDFAKDERPWVEALCDDHRRQRRSAGEGPGRELPEQGAPRHAGQGVRRAERAGRLRGFASFAIGIVSERDARDIMGFKCGIVGLPNVGKSTLFNALTETAAAQAANYPFCTIEPNVGEVAVPDPRLDDAGGAGEVRADRADAADLRRHRRAGARRLEGRGAGQPVPRQYPRGRRHRACGALLRGRRRHPCRGPHRSDRRHRDRSRPS